jgi:hypothetical protein
VDVLIHNKLQSFVFDTGASMVLDEDFAKTIPYQKIGSRKHYDPAGHKRMVRTVQLEPFSIGNIRFKKIVAGISKLTTLKNTICVDIVGILGANAMNKAVWQIDFQQKKIILTNSKDSLAQRTDNQIFSFYAQGNKTPKIRLSVAGNYITEADFDTGSNGSISLPKNFIQNVAPLSTFVKKYGITNTLFSSSVDTSYTTILPTLTIGNDLEIKNSITSFDHHLLYALIGTQFLKDYLVTIDWKYQEITLAAFKPNLENSFHTFGFSPLFTGDKIIIGALTEQAAAYNAGLKLGDKILKINQLDFQNLNQNDFCSIQQSMRNNRDTTLSIKVQREHQSIERILIKTNLLETVLNFKK